MTPGLDYIAVRIYRMNEDGTRPIIRGSGTLFEDNGSFFVLTAYHCLETRKEGKVITPLELEQTKIAFIYGDDIENLVEVDIIDMLDKDEDKDWALLSVEKPDVDWDYLGQVKFTNKVRMDLVYESYPYLTDYAGYPRYTELKATNGLGFLHIREEMTGGRYSVDSLMKGGSGAGVMHHDGNAFCCCGILKRTMEGGAFNDLQTVNMNDVMSLLSPDLIKQYTGEELAGKDSKDVKLMVDKLTAAKSYEELKALATLLLTDTIPALIEALKGDFVNGLLQSIEDHCDEVLKKENDICALYYFNKGEAFNQMKDVQSARKYIHQAYIIEKDNLEYLAREVRWEWLHGNKETARKLVSGLSDNHETKLAMEVIEAEKPQTVFMALPHEVQNDYRFRYRILVLDEGRHDFSSWLFDIKKIEPLSLSWSNWADWIFLFILYRNQFRDILLMRRMKEYDTKHYGPAFDVANKYFDLAKGTPLEKETPLLEALRCYWGYLYDIKHATNWLQAYQEIDFNKVQEDQSLFCKLMLGSMLSMEGRYDDAFEAIVKDEPQLSRQLSLFVIVLCNVSRKLEYFSRLMVETDVEGFVFGTAESQQLVNTAFIFDTEAFSPLLKTLPFEKLEEKRLLSDYNKLIHGGKVNVDEYSSFMMGFEGYLAAAAAQIVFNAGYQNEALDYLKGKFTAGSSDPCERTYIDLLGISTGRRYEYYEQIKSKRKAGWAIDENHLRQEYNYSLTLGDMDNALEVVDLIWQKNKTDGWVITAYIDLIGRKKPKDLVQWYDRALDFKFKEEHFVKTIYHAFAKNGYVDEATHFLYTKVKEMQSSDLNAFYDRECIMGFAAMIANKVYDTVEEGRYVTYTTNGEDRHCRQMSTDTVLGKALMGHKTDDEVLVVLAGQTKTVKIIGIHNQYYYLHYTNMHEVMESGGNSYFTPFQLDVEASDKGAKQFMDFLEQFGDGGAEQRAKNLYSCGQNGLYGLVKDDDVIGCYYSFLFSGFEMQVKSYTVYRRERPVLLKGDYSYVLDFTSLLLMFEFSLLNRDWMPKKRFQLPRFLRSIIEDYKKELPVKASLEMQQAMNEGVLYHFSNSYLDDLIQRFDALLTWINQHCDLVTNTAILQVDEPVKTAKQQLFVYTMIELLQQEGERRVLLTEDWYIEKLIGLPMPILSTETYMYELEGEGIGGRFTAFLKENHNSIS